MASIQIPTDADFQAAEQAARAAGMSMYIDGQRCVISPVPPAGAGWTKVGVAVINRHQARLTVQGGAA